MDTSRPTVLHYEAIRKRGPLLGQVNWKHFGQGFLLSVLYGPLAAVACFFYADFRYGRAYRHMAAPPPTPIIGWALVTIFLLLLTSLRRRVNSWSIVWGALTGTLLVPFIVAALFILGLSLSHFH